MEKGTKAVSSKNCEKDKKNLAFFYSVHLLKLLLATALITEQEYKRIIGFVARHYENKE